jgi:hypothetical protein
MKKFLLLLLASTGVEGLRPLPAPGPPSRKFTPPRVPPSGRFQRIEFEDDDDDDDKKKVAKVGNKGRFDSSTNITNYSYEKKYENSSLSTSDDVKLSGSVKIHVPFLGEKTAKISISKGCHVDLDDFRCDGPMDIEEDTKITNGTLISAGTTTVQTPVVIESNVVIVNTSAFIVNGNSSVTLNNVTLYGIITVTTQASVIFTDSVQVANDNIFTVTPVTTAGSVWFPDPVPVPIATATAPSPAARRSLKFVPASWAGACVYEKSTVVIGSGHMYCNAVNSGLIKPEGGLLIFSSLVLTPDSILDLGQDSVITTQEDIQLGGVINVPNTTKDGKVLIESYFGNINGSFVSGAENLHITNTSVIFRSPEGPPVASSSHARLIYILVPSIIGGVVLLVVGGVAIKNHRRKDEEMYVNPLLDVDV